jgi:hypothetical protein
MRNLKHHPVLVFSRGVRLCEALIVFGSERFVSCARRRAGRRRLGVDFERPSSDTPILTVCGTDEGHTIRTCIIDQHLTNLRGSVVD